MLIRQAKSIARRWAIKEVSHLPGFHGAYFAGSINALSDGTALSPTSDLDLNLVFTGNNGPAKIGKLVCRDVLLDVTCVSIDQLRSPGQVLGHYHLAGGFRTPSVILDPSGYLTALQTSVSRDFAKPEWVAKRCKHVQSRILKQLGAVNASDPVHDQIIGWVFPTGVTTHMLLVAALQNPTVRRRYVVARDVLANHGELDFYEKLLALLGCHQLGRARVLHHLAALTKVFDTAKTMVKTPFSFASEISDLARPIAIDGSRELVEAGLHREAVFWIVVTYSRCQKVLFSDAPIARQHQFDAAYLRLLADLGVASFADRQKRAEQVRELLPRLREVSRAITAVNLDRMESVAKR
jgi:hypothetical protein